MKVFFTFVCIIFSCSVDGYKILAVLPFASNSHYTIGNSIVKDYLEAGHEVTVISPFPNKEENPNRTDIVIDEIKDAFGDLRINPFELGEAGWLAAQLFVYQFGKFSVETIMTNPKVEELLNSDEKFDLVLYEVFGMDSFVGLGQHFGCPVIGYTTFGILKWANQLTGNPNGHSYVPHPFSGYTSKMTLYQRLHIKIISIIEAFHIRFTYLPIQRELYRRFFPKSSSTFDEDLKKVSLILLNDHFSQTSVKPYLPNMIEISGNHVQKSKPLPEDLQKYLDSAKDGVIYFSMGSMIQGKNWDPVKRETLVKAFGQLKTKVLWKYENDTLPNQPKNVKIGKWLPQRDILAHPNVKIFMGHGGLLGTTESIVTGKPIIAIPIYGDQTMNIAMAMEAGYALKIDYNDMRVENIIEIINEMLSNPKYTEEAEKIAKRFNDRPMSPQETAVYWTEYVIRHQGAPHLRSPGNDLSIIQFYMIDVYTILTIALALILMSISLITKHLIKYLNQKSNGNDKKKHN